METSMRLALYQPDIPQNAGTILRMAACFGIAVDIIGPAGFDMTNRALKRAGLDYLAAAEIARHVSLHTFLETREPGRIVLLTTRGNVAHHSFEFMATDTLLLGRESAGVPEHVHSLADARVTIPMRSGSRSLNIAVAAAIALGEGLRQTGGYPPPAGVSEKAPPPDDRDH
jgi:tRNA (cytidine/uridine-2'-O-)-methyltransferase